MKKPDPRHNKDRENNKKQEEVIPTYVSPVIKKAIEMAAARDDRSTSNFVARAALEKARLLGVTLIEAKEALENASKPE